MQWLRGYILVISTQKLVAMPGLRDRLLCGYGRKLMEMKVGY